jgi:hypothetical protein
MMQLRLRLQILGAIGMAAALVWGSGTAASALPQSERVRADVHSARVADYATDVVVPGSRFIHSRPTYDQ